MKHQESPSLLCLSLEQLSLSSVLPPRPARIDQVLLDDEVSDTEYPQKPCIERPLNPTCSPQVGRECEPDQSKYGAGGTANHDLLGGVVAQVYATDGYSSGAKQGEE